MSEHSIEKDVPRFPPIRHDDGTWTLWHPDSPGLRLRLRPSLLRRLRVVRSPFATLGETARYYKRKPCPLCGQPRRRHNPICPADTRHLPPRSSDA